MAKSRTPPDASLERVVLSPRMTIYLSFMNAALELVETVITTFRTLRIAGGKLHGRSGPLTGERGVIMDLARIGPDTVPNMARVRGTSRQHIQAIVDRLIEAGERESPAVAATRAVPPASG